MMILNLDLSCRVYKNYFPFLLFVSLSSFFLDILNSNNKFAAAAAAPIILNIILIFSILISYYLDLDIAKQLSYGVTLAGIIQLIFLIYFLQNFINQISEISFKSY